MLPPNMSSHLGMVPMLGMNVGVGGMQGSLSGSGVGMAGLGSMQGVPGVGMQGVPGSMMNVGGLPATMGNVGVGGVGVSGVGVLPGSMGGIVGGGGLIGPGHPQGHPHAHGHTHTHGQSPQMPHAPGHPGHIHAQSMSVLGSSGHLGGVKQEEMEGWGVGSGPGMRRRVRPGTSAGYEGSGSEFYFISIRALWYSIFEFILFFCLRIIYEYSTFSSFSFLLPDLY